ncbi:hypothetical protein VTN31DRAFT_5992 [Thermomyces dupontii]|uniref:uncharacterized protein n=1 Tax=Talaromyces thermophilus TaxID=28565 RepID=UPI003742DD48
MYLSSEITMGSSTASHAPHAITQSGKQHGCVPEQIRGLGPDPDRPAIVRIAAQHTPIDIPDAVDKLGHEQFRPNPISASGILTLACDR